MASIQALIDGLLRREFAEYFFHDITLLKAIPDAVQGEHFQRRDVILKETSLQYSHDEGGGRPYLRDDRSTLVMAEVSSPLTRKRSHHSLTCGSPPIRMART